MTRMHADPLPPLGDGFWGDRLTPAEAKGRVKNFYTDLAELSASLDHLNHDIARDIGHARSALFAAWSKLRAVEREMLEDERGAI